MGKAVNITLATFSFQCISCNSQRGYIWNTSDASDIKIKRGSSRVAQAENNILKSYFNREYTWRDKLDTEGQTGYPKGQTGYRMKQEKQLSPGGRECRDWCDRMADLISKLEITLQ
ncbi:hypothetical protein BsWGS_02992 [Bradybaena similaris]